MQLRPLPDKKKLKPFFVGNLNPTELQLDMPRECDELRDIIYASMKVVPVIDAVNELPHHPCEAQILRNFKLPRTPPPLLRHVKMNAPRSTFVVGQNRTTSPMVTPHAAYAKCAKKIPPHATSATAMTAMAIPATAMAAAAAGTVSTHPASAAKPSEATGDGAARRCQHAPPATDSVSNANDSTGSGTRSAKVTPPPQARSPPVTVATTTPATAAAGTAFGRIQNGGCGIEGTSIEELLDGSSDAFAGGVGVGVGISGGGGGGGGGSEGQAPSPSQGATTEDGSISQSGSDHGTAAAAAGAGAAGAAESAGTRGVGMSGAGYRSQQRGVDESMRRRAWGEGNGRFRRRRQEEEPDDDRSVVSIGAGEQFGGRENATSGLLRRALPSDGEGGERRAGGAREGRVPALGKLEEAKPALYEDVIDREVEDEDEDEDEDDDDDGDDRYEVNAGVLGIDAFLYFEGWKVKKPPQQLLCLRTTVTTTACR